MTTKKKLLSSYKLLATLLPCLLVITSLRAASAGNFYRDVGFIWGDQRGQILEEGNLLTLSLDNTSGSAFQSYSEYLFGRIDMQIKLVPDNSAGTVTTYYLSSQGTAHDEIDFEFLGNVSGQPYIVHTNVYAKGQGNREQQFYMWFDPTADFHNYSVVWNPSNIIFKVDNIPIRVFENNEAIGVPFPNSQAMTVYSSIWNADEWATEGGRVKTNWTLAPFTASYRNFNAESCVWSSASSCGSTSTTSISTPAWMNQELTDTGRKRLQWVQKNYMVYNYCTDFKRFPQGLPPECNQTTLN